MKDLLLWGIVFLGSAVFIIYGLTSYNESAAAKAYAQGQARAMIIEAQGQARLDTTIAVMPYLALATVTVFGGVILILAVVISRQKQAPRIERIETRILILPQTGSRRETYHLLSSGFPAITRGGRNEK